MEPSFGNYGQHLTLPPLAKPPDLGVLKNNYDSMVTNYHHGQWHPQPSQDLPLTLQVSLHCSQWNQLTPQEQVL